MTANLLYRGENLHVLRRCVEDASVDLIYLDPPFNSGAGYTAEGKRGRPTAFADTWRWDGEAEATYADLLRREDDAARAMHALHLLLGPDRMLAYLAMLAARLVELRRVLKSTGSIYLHCDPVASHYLKILMDAIFGPRNYRNELIWYYGGRGAKATARQFPRNHDVILLYSRTNGAQTYRQQYTRRRLTTTEAQRRGFRQDEQGRWFKTAPRGDYTDASIRHLEEAGRIYRTRTGRIRVKYFLESEDGYVVEDVLVGDTWFDVPDAMHLGKELTGYPTQKPRALLERIIASGTVEGDLVLDPFCGSGTALVAARRLGRRWIGIDNAEPAIELSDRRLREAFGEAVDYRIVVV